MKVSTYKIEITPSGKFFPCYLSGHAIRTEKAVGIMHQLWTNALLLSMDGSKMLWITVELIGLNRDFTDNLRKTISERYDIDRDAIYINYVHTHSAPEYQDVSFFGGPDAIKGYMSFVRSCILEATENCFEKELQEVKAYYQTVKIEGCYGNRNGNDKPCDKDVTLIKFEPTASIVQLFDCELYILNLGFTSIPCRNCVFQYTSNKSSSSATFPTAIPFPPALKSKIYCAVDKIPCTSEAAPSDTNILK